MTTLLEVKHAKVHFGGVRAVDGVTLALERGKLYGLVGPNGSGKTTLLNAISRLTPLTDGSLSWKGEDVTRTPAFRVARTGLARTFQAIRLPSTLTVRDNVMLGAELGGRQSGEARRRVSESVDRSMELLGVADVADAHPANLSYGTQRRVEIARALAGEPDLLLLDEPVAGMNRHERDEISEVLQSLRDRGLTQLLIEHDFRLMLEVADYLFVMNFGRCIARGKPRETAGLAEVQEAYLGAGHALA